MVGILIALAGAAVAGGSLLPWLSVKLDFGALADGTGSSPLVTALLHGVSIHGSTTHGVNTNAGKIVLLLGLVSVALGAGVALGAVGPWLRAATVSGLGAGAIACVWYFQNRPDTGEVVGLSVTPATGLWLVFAGAVAAPAAAAVAAGRRPARPRR